MVLFSVFKIPPTAKSIARYQQRNCMFLCVGCSVADVCRTLRDLAKP